MYAKIKLSNFLEHLEFHSPKKSSEYIGRKEVNPVMVLEENVAAWIRLTDLDDLQMSLNIFEGQVCIAGYPAIYSPQFWIANASLTAIHEVICGFLKTSDGIESELALSEMLFELWIKLLNSGPGSTHLHMLNIVLKTPEDPLWKYLETLRGDDLKTLIRTLQTDFVYKEEVSPDHYATLMETHIDKVFRSIFSSDQFEDSRRELLDLQIYYLSKMNHVPPHIGPRLSHLCFLICNRYEMENPYLGMDDWVLMRHHLKFIKDVITHQSFTKASEAQYRAPIVLEKILHAAVIDNMLDVMNKDFMAILQTITNNANSKKCMRLYAVFQTGLFEHLDLKRGFEECPYWLFNQTIQALSQLANCNLLEPHIEEFIVTTQNNFLLKFTKLSANEIAEWHKLLVNYILSGRKKLVTEAKRLLSNHVLVQNGVFDWKKRLKEARMLIDIVADFPREFLQNDDETSYFHSADAYSNFLQELFKVISNMDEGPRLQTEIRPNVHRCIVRCIEKDMEAKAVICLSCVTSSIPDFMDLLYVREVLFSIEKFLKTDDCPRSCDFLTEAIGSILDSCLQTFRDKGYIAVDYNTILMSITLQIVTAPNGLDNRTSMSKDMFGVLYERFVLAFIQMHCDKGSLKTISSLVFQTLNAIQEAISQGTSYGIGVDILELMGTKSFKLLSRQTKLIIELFVDWYCVDLGDIVKQLYSQSPECVIARLQDLFELIRQSDIVNKHKAFDVLYEVSKKCAQLFQDSNIETLLMVYPEETELSKDFIIKILLEVLDQHPQLLKQHADVIVDEMTFSTTYFSERCKIMFALSSQNKDIAVVAEDFLMKYITDKDEQVALKAIKTLVPLIKHQMFPARKTRLKVLMNSIKCKEVRELCMELLPELRNNSRKSEPNQAKNVKETKPSAIATQNRARTPIRQFPLPHSVKTKPVSGKSVTKPVREVQSPGNRLVGKLGVTTGRGDGKLVSSDKLTQGKQDTEKIENGDKSEIKDKFEKRINVQEEEKIRDKGRKSVFEKEEMKGKDKQSDELSQSHSQDIGDTDRSSSSPGPLPAIRTERLNTPIQTEPASDDVNKPAVEWERVIDYAEVEDENSNKTLILPQNSVNNPEVHKSSSDSNILTTTSNETYSDETVMGICGRVVDSGKSICIYGAEKDNYKLMAFSNVLKDAGYDGDIVFKAADVMNMDARVVLICCSREVNSGVIGGVTKLVKENKSAMYIKLDQTAQPAVQPPHRPCIRMFVKPGETTLRGQWPALKFFELLMHLNYQGILPKDHLLSQEFKEWWKPQSRSNLKSVSINIRGDDKVVGRSFAATVFVSYHWGKEKQVEPLHKHLTDQGISCWVGLQQIGGSESLYNKISQGIQECRVVLACITPQYTRTENCKQEVNIALGLNRPVIPLLVKTNWPIRDEIGDKLASLDCLKMVMTADGKIDVKGDVIKTLVNYIKRYTTDVGSEVDKSQQEENTHQKGNQKSVERGVGKTVGKTVRGKTVKENMHLTNNDQFPGDFESITVKGLSKNMIVQKSMSMCELEQKRNCQNSQIEYENAGTGISIDAERRKSHYDIPDGVIIDDLGYTVKTNRSKSCVIL